MNQDDGTYNKPDKPRSYHPTLLLLLICSLLLHFLSFLTLQTVYKSPSLILITKRPAQKNLTWTFFEHRPIKKRESKPLHKKKLKTPITPKPIPKAVEQPSIPEPGCGKAKLVAYPSIFNPDGPNQNVIRHGNTLPSNQTCTTELKDETLMKEQPVTQHSHISTLSDSEKINSKEPPAVPNTTVPQPQALSSGSNLDNRTTSIDIAQRIAEIDRRQALIDGYRPGCSSTQQTHSIHSPSPTTGTTKRAVNGKRPNIIALTKGFLDTFSTNQKGNALIDRDGDENSAPSFEEEEYISYEATINWCLQSSWKRHFERSRQAHLRHQSQSSYIDFVIDEQGNLVSCTLLQSSGSRENDAAIMKNMRLATPFPPIPKHFNMQTYHTGRRISIFIGPS